MLGQVSHVYTTIFFWGMLLNACVIDKEMDSEKEKNMPDGHYSLLTNQNSDIC